MSPSGPRKWTLVQKQHLSIPSEPGAGQEFRSTAPVSGSSKRQQRGTLLDSHVPFHDVSKQWWGRLSCGKHICPAASEARSQCLCLPWGDLSHQVFPSSLHSGLQIHGIYHPLPSSSTLPCIWPCLCSFTVHLLLRNGSSLFSFLLDLMFQQSRAQQWSRAPLQLSIRV